VLLGVLEPFSIELMIIGGRFTLFDTWWPHQGDTFQSSLDSPFPFLVMSNIVCIICLRVLKNVFVVLTRLRHGLRVVCLGVDVYLLQLEILP
jgi:hypothetical protein